MGDEQLEVGAREDHLGYVTLDETPRDGEKLLTIAIIVSVHDDAAHHAADPRLIETIGEDDAHACSAERSIVEAGSDRDVGGEQTDLSDTASGEEARGLLDDTQNRDPDRGADVIDEDVERVARHDEKVSPRALEPTCRLDEGRTVPLGALIALDRTALDRVRTRNAPHEDRRARLTTTRLSAEDDLEVEFS